MDACPVPLMEVLAAQSCLTVTPWTVVYQAPLSMGFSRQEHWSGLPFPFPGDLLDRGIKPGSFTSPLDSLPLSVYYLVRARILRAGAGPPGCAGQSDGAGVGSSPLACI